MEPLIADVLERAADLIEPEGKWLQGHLAGNSNGYGLRAATTGADYCARCWCAFGAIQKAGWLCSRDAEKRSEDIRIISFHRREIEAAGYVEKVIAGDIILWNDAPERAQIEVVAALRKAAALAREQGK